MWSTMAWEAVSNGINALIVDAVLIAVFAGAKHRLSQITLKASRPSGSLPTNIRSLQEPSAGHRRRIRGRNIDLWWQHNNSTDVCVLQTFCHEDGVRRSALSSWQQTSRIARFWRHEDDVTRLTLSSWQGPITTAHRKKLIDEYISRHYQAPQPEYMLSCCYRSGAALGYVEGPPRARLLPYYHPKCLIGTICWLSITQFV